MVINFKISALYCPSEGFHLVAEEECNKHHFCFRGLEIGYEEVIALHKKRRSLQAFGMDATDEQMDDINYGIEELNKRINEILASNYREVEVEAEEKWNAAKGCKEVKINPEVFGNGWKQGNIRNN